jgi:hypothetical protein
MPTPLMVVLFMVVLFTLTLTQAYGRSALMLSGGAGLGMHHFGIIKTLHTLDLLPTVISGSSAGTCFQRQRSNQNRVAVAVDHAGATWGSFSLIPLGSPHVHVRCTPQVAPTTTIRVANQPKSTVAAIAQTLNIGRLLIPWSLDPLVSWSLPT